MTRLPTLLLACAPLFVPVPEEGLGVEAGPLRLEVHISRTAHLYHVVDQLSGWSEFCHDQYVRGMEPLSDEDRAVLERYAAVREAYGWGGGTEQAFYTAAPLARAVAEGIESGALRAEDGPVFEAALEHFAERVDALLASDRPGLEAFRARILDEVPQLEALAKQLARLMGAVPPTVPVFLIATPSDHDMGGGFNGGRLTLEIPRVADPLPTFQHELFHAFVSLRLDDLVKAAEGLAPPFDVQTLNEGLTHAVAPGLIHALGPDRDPLAERVAAAERRGEGLDTYFGRIHRYALALRPLMREALADEQATLDEVLPKAIEVWGMVLAESGSAESERPSGG